MIIIAREREVKKVIGNRIQEILDKKGMTQIELAEKVDMSVAHINRIINGKSEPDKTVAKIAQALNVPVHALYSEDAQISALAIKNLENLPTDIVRALGDKGKLEYLIVGLGISDTGLSPEEARIVIEEGLRTKKRLEGVKKNK
jgi:transcriptional regulator with XRE-family HTH domain